MKIRLNQYYRDVYHCLPCDRKMKKKIIIRLKENLDGYLEEHPSAGTKEVMEHFGTPQQIAGTYIEEMTTSEIIMKFGVKKRVVAGVALIAAIAVVAYLMVLAAAYAKEKDSADGYYEEDPIVEVDGEEIK